MYLLVIIVNNIICGLIGRNPGKYPYVLGKVHHFDEAPLLTAFAFSLYTTGCLNPEKNK